MTTYPLLILISLCLFCLALGGVITFIACAAWYLKWLAQGEADVNGDPERDSGALPLSDRQEAASLKGREAICTALVIGFLIVSLMAVLGKVLFE
jgi:flagellar biogenesis protein FliO